MNVNMQRAVDNLAKKGLKFLHNQGIGKRNI